MAGREKVVGSALAVAGEKIEVRCLGCGTRFRAPSSYAGKKARCPKCGGVIEIPADKVKPVEEVAVEETAEEEPAPAQPEAEPQPKLRGKTGRPFPARGARSSRLAALRERGARGRAAAGTASAPNPRKGKGRWIVVIVAALLVVGGSAFAVWKFVLQSGTPAGGAAPESAPATAGESGAAPVQPAAPASESGSAPATTPQPPPDRRPAGGEDDEPPPAVDPSQP